MVQCNFINFLKCFLFTLNLSLKQKRRLFPFFLMSGQGLSKSFEKDAWPVRHCVSLGLEVMCAQSFGHTFGLYGERMNWKALLLFLLFTGDHEQG